MAGREQAATRILFIGNSYTSRNDLPGMLRDIAAASVPSRLLEAVSIVAGGASLRRHWNAGTALRTLNESHWDFVVLQEQSTLPIKNEARYHDNVRLFAGEARSLGVPVVLYLPWSRENAAAAQADLDRAVTAISVEVGATVAQVGPAWRALQAQAAELILYEPDGSHPTRLGSYLAACVFHRTLFGARVSEHSTSDALGINRATAILIRDVANRLGDAASTQQ